MASVEVRPITFPRDARRFVDTWFHIYRGDPAWVPPLVSEQVRFLDPRKNPYFRVATVQAFQAWRDGVSVGTIAATHDHEQARTEPGTGFFGFFEFTNDPEVATALFDAAAGWLHAQGITKARGPFNFNPNHEFGLLVSRFDDPPCIGNPHNAWWYPDTYENVLGMRRARDWYAYWIPYGPMPAGMKRVSDRLLARHPEIRLVPMSRRDYWRDVDVFWELYNDAWSGNWGHVHMEREEFRDKARALRPVLDEKLALFAYVGDEPAAAVITLPDYNQVAAHMNGGLFPFGWVHFAMRNVHIRRWRVLVLGVRHKFQHLPLGAPLYVAMWEEAVRRGTVRGVEASLVLEDNHRMRGAMERLGATIYKTYRTYEKALA